MAKAKKGDVLSCQVCGLIVAVDEVGNCGISDVVCCEEPMEKGKMAANKARKAAAKVVAKPAAKRTAKKAVKKTVRRTAKNQ